MTRRIKAGLPGYSLVDYAFKDAAGTVEYPHDGTYGLNRGYYRWTGLGQAKLPPGIEPWDAPPEDVNKVITKAAKYFRQVSKLLPGDEVSAMYFDRCKSYLNSPPPANWKGIHFLTEK